MTARAFAGRVERLELKYLLGEPRARRIARQIRAYCSADPHNESGYPDGGSGYPVQSLYLDTPSLAFHRAKERGASERFKLRVRSYRGLGPVCLEIKRRSSDVVEKRRALVARDGLRETLRGAGGKLWQETPESRQMVDDFARLVLQTGAEPKLLVRYQREAYVSDVDSYARVTFDRDIAFQRTERWSVRSDEPWQKLADHWIGRAPLVVLELKCETTVPAWLLDLVRSQQLRRDSVSKYSLGIYVTRRALGGGRGAERARGVLR